MERRNCENQEEEERSGLEKRMLRDCDDMEILWTGPPVCLIGFESGFPVSVPFPNSCSLGASVCGSCGPGLIVSAICKFRMPQNVPVNLFENGSS